MMKKISRRSFLQASGLAAAAAALTACGGSGTGSDKATAANTAHEPITIMDAQRDYTNFLALLHEQYPEIHVEIVPYCGNNTTAYMSKQLRTGILPDIYTTTQAWDGAWQKDGLIDLSQYAVSDQFNEVRMNDTDVDGANYLLPYDYVLLSLGCNQTLFEKHGWQVPRSFAELKALVPQIKAAGVELCTCQLNLPGFGFQYFCNVADTLFLNAISGLQWQQDFLAGAVTASGSPEMQEAKDYFQEWIDLGILNSDQANMSRTDCFSHFAEGNTAFYVGTLSRYTQNEDGTGDRYVCLPYLSPDGADNCYILQNSRYYGLNKHLAEPGNEQKLEDALHFLELLASMEGYGAIIGNTSTVLCALRDFQLDETSPYFDALENINNGHSAPMIYTGWEGYIVPFGNSVISWIKGECTGDDALNVLDDQQTYMRKNGQATVYAQVTEELDNEQTTKLIAMMALDQTDADAALISRNVWYPEVNANQENNQGVNGTMLPGDLTEEDIVINLPTGWGSNLQKLTLTGARLKELAAAGYDRNSNGLPYPYLLLTRDGKELADDQTYTFICCGCTDAVGEEGHAEDTGILDAAKAYFSKLGTISPETVA